MRKGYLARWKQREKPEDRVIDYWFSFSAEKAARADWILERMKFVATAPDVPAGAVGLIKYTRIRDVNCPTCQRTFYLWTSIIGPQASEIVAAVKRLTKILIEECRKREHADYIRMLD